MPTTYHKRKRRRWHTLKKMIIVLLGVLEKRVEHEDKERIQHFIRFLQKLYE